HSLRRRFWPRMIKLFLVALVLVVLSSSADAQVTDQDSVCGGFIRPRRESFLIQAFPNPVQRGGNVNIYFYNHQEDEISVELLDLLDRPIKILQARKKTSNALHNLGPL